MIVFRYSVFGSGAGPPTLTLEETAIGSNPYSSALLSPEVTGVHAAILRLARPRKPINISHMGVSPNFRGTILGVPIIRTIVFGGL